MADDFYTPTAIAEKLIAPFRSREERCVADFAAGDGELLRAAEKKWPDANVIATDIDVACVRRLRVKHASWRVGKCNFLNCQSRNRCAVVRESVGKVSLLLLNPPFSCPGNERHVAVMLGRQVQCSRAMAFILGGIEYLSRDGRIAAIVPASSLTSQKDADAWDTIRSQFSVKVHSSFGVRTFPGCSASTAIVTLTRNRTARRIVVTEGRQFSGDRIPTTIIRGVVPVHAARNGLAGPEWPMVHTTNLQQSAVQALEFSINTLHRYALGPAVLLPRVGKPDSRKCALYLRNRKLVLSDCIFAISCESRQDAESVHRRIIENWELIAECYNGTCAPYLTIASLCKCLEQIGCDVIQIEATGYGTVERKSRKTHENM